MPKATPTTKKSQPEVPAHALTFLQWKSNAPLQKELTELLESPIFKMACQTLLHTAMPNAKPVPDLTAGLTAEAMMYADAIRYHNRSGFTQFLRALKGLARPQGTTRQIGSEWGELLPEDN
jgi:hypothetical protein